MVDELDPQIVQWFAVSEETLPAGDFAIRVYTQLRRRRARERLGRVARTILDGAAAGLSAPFGAPLRYRRLLAASAALTTLWIALQGIL
jgi:hypothetical protein